VTAILNVVDDRRPRLSGQPRAAVLHAIRDYLELSKSRIVLMVLITTAAGFLFAGSRDFILLLNTLIGTALVAAGTNALNQYVEREYDGRMRRTRLRPLPDGRIAPRTALLFAWTISAIGTVYLALAVNWMTALLGAFTLTSYIFVYTPLKRASSLCTIVGAVPGAVPALMGWTAATGALGIGGWIAFAIVFLWQLPHFMAISWMYREDYDRAGFVMLAVRDAEGKATALQAICYSVALLALSVLPQVFGQARLAAIVAAAVLVAMSIAFLLNRSNRSARRLFMTSNIYLLVAMALLVLG
jgi:protoheme IX farnesyltransferase